MQLRTQVAALALARDRGLPVPRMIAADLSGSQAGVLALVTSVLPGSSAIPGRCPPGGHASWARRRSAIHAVALTPRPDLPRRTRPLADMDFAAWRRSAGITPLLARAERQVSELPVPGGAAVLVHGDLWQGNTLWSAGVCTGVIDWDAAGAGSPGIDLGTLRLDAALYYGPAPQARSSVAGGKLRAGSRSTSRTGTLSPR